MSRSGYDDGYSENNWGMICYRGAVASAARGRKGQRFFTDLLAALDAMPEKRLIKNELEDETGSVCALGALGRARGVDMKPLDPEDPETVAATFGIATSLAREVVFENDEAPGCWSKETPEQRFARVRSWVASQIRAATPPHSPSA